MEKHEATAAPIEPMLAGLLQVGSAIAAGLMGLGVLLTVLGFLPQVSVKLLTSGLVVLMVTPVARVVAALLFYLRRRDLFYILFCLVVLVILAVGVLVGKAT